MKKRVDLEYGQGKDDILFSAKTGNFFSYENDGGKLHELYGGERYYVSNTGLTGAGYLEVKPGENDLIKFGYYRTDARSMQEIATVHKLVNGQEIFGYAPITSHGGIGHAKPFVLTDGHKVAFVASWDVRTTLLEWEEIRGKEINIEYYTSEGYKYTHTSELYNPQHFRGVRFTRFVDLEAERRDTNGLSPGHSCFAQKLSICENDEKWFHLSLDGIFDKMWETDPRELVGEIVNSWVSSGNGLYWRRRRNDVETFVEVKRSEFAGGKYVVEGETGEWLDYEQNFSVLEWFSREPEEWREYFQPKLTKKAREDYIHARQRSGVDTKKLMKENPEALICIQDSLDTGNCLSGTQSFIREYGIEVEDDCSTVKNLLENKRIDEMLKNFYFQKVIARKLLDPDKETKQAEEE